MFTFLKKMERIFMIHVAAAMGIVILAILSTTAATAVHSSVLHSKSSPYQEHGGLTGVVKLTPSYKEQFSLTNGLKSSEKSSNSAINLLQSNTDQDGIYRNDKYLSLQPSKHVLQIESIGNKDKHSSTLKSIENPIGTDNIYDDKDSSKVLNGLKILLKHGEAPSEERSDYNLEKREKSIHHMSKLIPSDAKSHVTTYVTSQSFSGVPEMNTLEYVISQKELEEPDSYKIFGETLPGDYESKKLLTIPIQNYDEKYNPLLEKPLEYKFFKKSGSNEIPNYDEMFPQYRKNQINEFPDQRILYKYSSKYPYNDDSTQKTVTSTIEFIDSPKLYDDKTLSKLVHQKHARQEESYASERLENNYEVMHHQHKLTKPLQMTIEPSHVLHENKIYQINQELSYPSTNSDEVKNYKLKSSHPYKIITHHLKETKPVEDATKPFLSKSEHKPQDIKEERQGHHGSKHANTINIINKPEKTSKSYDENHYYKIKIKSLIHGVNPEDYSGEPDLNEFDEVYPSQETEESFSDEFPYSEPDNFESNINNNISDESEEKIYQQIESPTYEPSIQESTDSSEKNLNYQYQGIQSDIPIEAKYIPNEDFLKPARKEPMPYSDEVPTKSEYHYVPETYYTKPAEPLEYIVKPVSPGTQEQKVIHYPRTGNDVPKYTKYIPSGDEQTRISKKTIPDTYEVPTKKEYYNVPKSYSTKPTEQVEYFVEPASPEFEYKKPVLPKQLVVHYPNVENNISRKNKMTPNKDAPTSASVVPIEEYHDSQGEPEYSVYEPMIPKYQPNQSMHKVLSKPNNPHESQVHIKKSPDQKHQVIGNNVPKHIIPKQNVEGLKSPKYNLIYHPRMNSDIESVDETKYVPENGIYADSQKHIPDLYELPIEYKYVPETYTEPTETVYNVTKPENPEKEKETSPLNEPESPRREVIYHHGPETYTTEHSQTEKYVIEPASPETQGSPEEEVYSPEIGSDVPSDVDSIPREEEPMPDSKEPTPYSHEVPTHPDYHHEPTTYTSEPNEPEQYVIEPSSPETPYEELGSPEEVVYSPKIGSDVPSDVEYIPREEEPMPDSKEPTLYSHDVPTHPDYHDEPITYTSEPNEPKQYVIEPSSPETPYEEPGSPEELNYSPEIGSDVPSDVEYIPREEEPMPDNKEPTPYSHEVPTHPDYHLEPITYTSEPTEPERYVIEPSSPEAPYEESMLPEEVVHESPFDQELYSSKQDVVHAPVANSRVPNVLEQSPSRNGNFLKLGKHQPNHVVHTVPSERNNLHVQPAHITKSSEPKFTILKPEKPGHVYKEPKVMGSKTPKSDVISVPEINSNVPKKDDTEPSTDSIIPSSASKDSPKITYKTLDQQDNYDMPEIYSESTEPEQNIIKPASQEFSYEEPGSPEDVVYSPEVKSDVPNDVKYIPREEQATPVHEEPIPQYHEVPTQPGYHHEPKTYDTEPTVPDQYVLEPASPETSHEEPGSPKDVVYSPEVESDVPSDVKYIPREEQATPVHEEPIPQYHEVPTKLEYHNVPKTYTMEPTVPDQYIVEPASQETRYEEPGSPEYVVYSPEIGSDVPSDVKYIPRKEEPTPVYKEPMPQYHEVPTQPGYHHEPKTYDTEPTEPDQYILEPASPETSHEEPGSPEYVVYSPEVESDVPSNIEYILRDEEPTPFSTERMQYPHLVPTQPASPETLLEEPGSPEDPVLLSQRYTYSLENVDDIPRVGLNYASYNGNVPFKPKHNLYQVSSKPYLSHQHQSHFSQPIELRHQVLSKSESLNSKPIFNGLNLPQKQVFIHSPDMKSDISSVNHMEYTPEDSIQVPTSIDKSPDMLTVPTQSDYPLEYEFHFVNPIEVSNYAVDPLKPKTIHSFNPEVYDNDLKISRNAEETPMYMEPYFPEQEVEDDQTQRHLIEPNISSQDIKFLYNNKPNSGPSQSSIIHTGKLSSSSSILTQKTIHQTVPQSYGPMPSIKLVNENSPQTSSILIKKLSESIMNDNPRKNSADFVEIPINIDVLRSSGYDSSGSMNTLNQNSYDRPKSSLLVHVLSKDKSESSLSKPIHSLTNNNQVTKSQQYQTLEKPDQFEIVIEETQDSPSTLLNDGIYFTRDLNTSPIQYEIVSQRPESKTLYTGPDSYFTTYETRSNPITDVPRGEQIWTVGSTGKLPSTLSSLSSSQKIVNQPIIDGNDGKNSKLKTSRISSHSVLLPFSLVHKSISDSMSTSSSISSSKKSSSSQKSISQKKDKSSKK
ncbi:titin-like [Trichogramma pretiosum]|uniref:titin-like n=1 Tax=Trichogramma pretiosum TaxID=7493 RepID=UPI000C71A097|nr:titin-like [Trichogramma pretiosum]